MSVESANQADTLSDLLSTKKVNLASLELVGSGVYSLVYRLRGHDVVVKTVAEVGLAHHAIETSIYKRLGRHISILSYLGEVDVLGSEEVMRGLIVAYCVGGTLEDFLKYPKHDQEYDERKLQWMIQVANAVGYIHGNGIIHGDIGVHNIMISKDQALKLIDFGGSRLDGSRCLCFPSARYRRLPSWLEESYEPEVKDDIFALGIVLYEIYTGHKAYPGLESSDVLERIVDGHFPEVHNIEDPQMRAILLRCWTCQYESAAEIVDALSSLTKTVKD